jgi:hypothetical protein
VKHEKEGSEEDKGALITQMDEDKITMKELEDSLLERLSAFDVNLIEDTELMNTQDRSNKMSAESTEFIYALCLITSDAAHRNLAGPFRYLKFSAENGITDGQLAVACMAENGVLSSINFDTGIRYYERCSNHSTGILSKPGSNKGWIGDNGGCIDLDFWADTNMECPSVTTISLGKRGVTWMMHHPEPSTRCIQFGPIVNLLQMKLMKVTHNPLNQD